MPSHSQSHAGRSNRKRTTPKMQHQNKKAQPVPRAPAELDAILGYGTSSSFPLFMAGIVPGVKKIFSRKKRK